MIINIFFSSDAVIIIVIATQCGSTVCGLITHSRACLWQKADETQVKQYNSADKNN